MADNIFGLETPDAVNAEDFEDEPAPEEEPEQDPALDEAEPEAPAADANDGADEAVEEPAPPIEVPELLANDPSVSKFKSYEALVEGYKNALMLHNRSAARAREAEQSAQEWQNAANQAMGMLKSRETPAPQGLPDDIKRIAEEAGVDENTLRLAQALASRTTSQEVQNLQSQMLADRAQAQQQAQQQALQASVQAFFTRHPEVTEGSEMDTRLGDLVRELELDPSNTEALEAAYEVAQDAELELYVRANPHLVDSAEGMAHAKHQVALNKQLTSAASAHTAAQNVSARQAALRRAQVETGGGAPPTSPGGETDEWAQVLAVAKSDRNEDNAFGLPT